MPQQTFISRHIAITGGAGDIGLACARLFLDAGATVHLIDIDAERLNQSVKQLDAGDRLTCAVSDLADLTVCSEALMADRRPPYALVHLAGVFEEDHLDGTKGGVWQRAMSSNLASAYDMAIAFRALHDRRQDARIVLCTSRAFQRATPGRAAYAAAKGGIVGLVRSFSRDFAPDILVNAVSPGLIETRMTQSLIKQLGQQRLAEIPLQRYGTPDDVANVIAFLCSDASAYITGQVITVDGGVING